MKFKNLQLAKHDNLNMSGFESMVLLVDGEVSKCGYFESGIVIAQFFGPTTGEAEAYAEYFYNLHESNEPGVLK